MTTAAASADNERPRGFALWLQTLGIGAVTTALHFSVNHPFDAIATKMQATSGPPYPTARGQVRAVFRESGVPGFYRGGLANFSRLSFKAAYRGPTRPAVKSAVARCVHDGPRKQEVVNAATGVAMALADTIVLTPLERLKVVAMTAPTGTRLWAPLAGWWRDGTVVQQLTRGMLPSFLRSSSSWTTWLVLEERVDTTVRRSAFVAQQSWFVGEVLRSLITGIIGGLVNVGATLPFENVKTQFQRHGSVERRSIAAVLAYLFAQRGLRGVYAGASVRLPSYVLVGAIQAQAIRRVDALWGIGRTDPLTATTAA